MAHEFKVGRSGVSATGSSMAPRDLETSSTPGRKLIYGLTVGQSALTLLKGQLRWFSEHGWDVTLVASMDRHIPTIVNQEGVRFFPIDMRRQVSPFRDIISLLKWLRFLARERPQAVNVSTPKAGLIGGVAAKLFGIDKRIYVLRGLRLEGTSGVLRYLLWVMEWVATHAATDVVVVSRSLAHEAAALHLLPKSRCWIVGNGSSNGVPAEAISRRVAEVDTGVIRASLGFNLDDFVIGFVGRVTVDKGLDTLLLAFRDLGPHFKLLVIGPTEDTDLSKRMVKFGPQVKHIEWTNDVWGYLPAMDCLALPTIREGFPNVVLEAASAGIPSITTRATGACDSVVDGVTGLLVEVGDTEGLRDGIERLEGDRDLLSALGEAARRRADQDFSPERIWGGLLAILESDVKGQDVSRL